MRVSVSGKQFVFPRSCACCGGYPLTSLPVVGAEQNKRARTKGWVFDIPYCLACRRHIRAAERILLLTLLLAAISLVSGFFRAVSTNRWPLGLETLGFLLFTSLLLGWILWQLVRSRRPINCTGMTRSVSYLSSNGSCHSFEIRSGWYAAEFVLANHRKLVNASPRVVSILKGTRFGNYQVPRRIVGSQKRRPY